MKQPIDLEQTVTNLNLHKDGSTGLTCGKKIQSGLLVVLKGITKGRAGIKTTKGIKVRVTKGFRSERIPKGTKLDRSIYSTAELSRVTPCYPSRSLTLLRSERYFP